jgi:flagellar hook-associated protein 3 FlgL
MSTIRTGDLAQFNRSMNNMQEVQSRLRYGNLKVSTGKAAHTYAELGAESGKLMRTETALQRTEMFAEQNTRLGQELNLMDGALATVEEIAQDFQRTLIARRNDATGDDIRLDLEAQGMIDRIVGELNLKVDGRYVFAGSRTDTPPVDAGAISDDETSEAFYQGDRIPLRARIDVDAEVSYGVLAVDEAFRNLFAGLKTAIDGHGPPPGGDDSLLQEAATLAEQALDGVIAKRSELATFTARVESVRGSQEGTALYLKDALSDIVDTDVPATMAQISQDQVSLEASYSIMSRLSRLSLTDYLR